jgi:hypothetical protein
VVAMAGPLDCVGVVGKRNFTMYPPTVLFCEKIKGPEQGWEGGLLHMERNEGSLHDAGRAAC